MSGSEKWGLYIRPTVRTSLADPGNAVASVENTAYGWRSEKLVYLETGKEYYYDMRHLDSSYDPPDYDYMSLIGRQQSSGVYTGANGKGIFILDDYDDLLRSFFAYEDQAAVLEPNPILKNNETAPKTGKITILNVELKEVSFSGTKYHTVKKDDSSGDYTAPHWQDNSSPLDGDADDAGDKKYPICFTRNTKMKVSAKWHIEPSGLGVTVKVKGDGPGNLDFPETTATISGNDLTITDVECSNPFVNEVDFFDPMSIVWSFSVDGGSTWCDAGTSANQTYVTLGDPLTTVFHTLAHLGCKNADGENTAANCTSKIWSEFTDRDVRRVDGVQLTYYASYTCANVDTASLLANGDGQCGSWASLFIDMRKVQGIDDTDEYVQFFFEGISGLNPQLFGFVVKNWAFSGAGSSGANNFPYLNIPDANLIGTSSYNWKFAEVNDQTGIAGQGNANPASLFNNHQVFISGEYYDPSYGVKYTSLQDIDDNSIDGYYFIIPAVLIDEASLNVDVNGDGDKLDSFNGWPVDETVVNLDVNNDGDKLDTNVPYPDAVYLFKQNPAGLDLIEQRFDF